MHHDAQKFTTTTRPRRLSSESGVPAKLVRVKGAAGLPSSVEGSCARIGAEAVGQQDEERQHRDRDEPAEVTRHAGFLPSGRTARAAPRVRMNPPIHSQETMRFTCTLTVAWEPSRAKSPSTR